MNPELRAAVEYLERYRGSKGITTRNAIATVLSALAEMEKDAARLDWLSDNPVHTWGFAGFPQAITMNGQVFLSVRHALDHCLDEQSAIAAADAADREGK